MKCCPENFRIMQRFYSTKVHLTPDAIKTRCRFVTNLDSRKCLTLAVDGHGTLCALTDVQKASCEEITRCGAVYEEQVVMFKPSICEAPPFIDFLVQSHNICHTVLPEVGKVRFWSMERITLKSQNSHRFISELLH